MTDALLRQLLNDRDEAHEHAVDGLRAIEALQSTNTWHELPLSVRRALCASHAALGSIADAIAQA